jgi:tripartite-type tricarboxylate transporter receptor subunit TctC
VHVPYKGSSGVVVDLIAGNISCSFTTFATTRQHLKSGRLRALAIAAKERSKDFPAVPTLSEAGFAGFEAATWHGVIARAETPPAIVSRLNSAIAGILKSREIHSNLVTAGFDVGAGSTEDFRRFVREEIEKWKKVATVAHVRLD